MSHRRKGLAIVVVFVALAALGPAGAQDASRLPFETSEPHAKAVLKPGANSFVESQAKQLLQAKGYTDISTLKNDADGIWRGTATKNSLRVDVSVDFQGHVAEK